MNAGTGLSVSAGAAVGPSVTLEADTTYLQRRVGSTCAAGSSIREIAADGTVTCETDDSGGAGLQGARWARATDFANTSGSATCNGNEVLITGFCTDILGTGGSFLWSGGTGITWGAYDQAANMGSGWECETEFATSIQTYVLCYAP